MRDDYDCECGCSPRCWTAWAVVGVFLALGTVILVSVIEERREKLGALTRRLEQRLQQAGDDTARALEMAMGVHRRLDAWLASELEWRQAFIANQTDSLPPPFTPFAVDPYEVFTFDDDDVDEAILVVMPHERQYMRVRPDGASAAISDLKHVRAQLLGFINKLGETDTHRRLGQCRVRQ